MADISEYSGQGPLSTIRDGLFACATRHGSCGRKACRARSMESAIWPISTRHTPHRAEPAPALLLLGSALWAAVQCRPETIPQPGAKGGKYEYSAGAVLIAGPVAITVACKMMLETGAQSEPPWQAVRGKPNTPELLGEKAIIVSRLFPMTYGIGNDFASALKEYSGTPLSKDQVLETKAETAALCLYIVLGISSKYLSVVDRDLFIKSLLAAITDDLAVQGIEPAYFHNLTGDRIEQYVRYSKWMLEGSDNDKDRLMLEFSKHLALILDIPEIEFLNIMVSTFILKQFGQWELGDLLAG